MTADSPNIPFDAELAWDLSEWNETNPDSNGGTKLAREEIIRLAGHLTSKGYHNGEKAGITASLKYLEEAGAKLADEFLPLFEARKKRYADEK